MLFKSGFFFFSPSVSLVFLVFFLGGALLLHVYTEPTKRFWLLLCRLGWSIEEPGVGRRGAREKSARHRMTHSISFSLAFEWRVFFFWWRGCAAFRGFETRSPSWLPPPLDGPIRACLLLAKLVSCRSHPTGGAQFAVPGAELNWHLASSLRVALNLHINLHRSLIGDKCTCFLFIELCKCIQRFT